MTSVAVVIGHRHTTAFQTRPKQDSLIYGWVVMVAAPHEHLLISRTNNTDKAPLFMMHYSSHQRLRLYSNVPRRCSREYPPLLDGGLVCQALSVILRDTSVVLPP